MVRGSERGEKGGALPAHPYERPYRALRCMSNWGPSCHPAACRAPPAVPRHAGHTRPVMLSSRPAASAKCALRPLLRVDKSGRLHYALNSPKAGVRARPLSVPRTISSIHPTQEEHMKGSLKSLLYLLLVVCIALGGYAVSGNSAYCRRDRVRRVTGHRCAPCHPGALRHDAVCRWTHVRWVRQQRHDCPIAAGWRCLIQHPAATYGDQAVNVLERLERLGPRLSQLRYVLSPGTRRQWA